MIGKKVLQSFFINEGEKPLLGTKGYLGIFLWSLGMIMFSPESRVVHTAALCLLAAAALYPDAFRRLLRLRWLFLLGSLLLINGLWMGEADTAIMGISVSSIGLQAGAQMGLRALVILVAVDGFSSSVDISEVAGLLERLGLRGLGFSLGIAVNLLPEIRKSAANIWRSLYMRGGLRQQRWRAIQLFMVTLMANALRRGDDIALAAEARAFTADRTRSFSLRKGRMDGWIIAFGVMTMVAFLVIPA